MGYLASTAALDLRRRLADPAALVLWIAIPLVIGGLMSLATGGSGGGAPPRALVLLADRDVEIVADRGVAGGVVSAAQWEACCQVMESRFRTGAFREGAIAGIEAVAAVLARHPPGRAAGNELPDAPALL